MKTICLYFEIHQMVHLKRYRFFDIGTDHYYYDDYANETTIEHVTANSYIPALKTLIKMVKSSNGYFKVALSISGVGIEQLERYSPAVIDLMHELNATGCCEFLAEPYSHGLSSLALNGEDGFRDETLRLSDKIFQLFGQKPTVFRNSGLIYNDDIGLSVAKMGFKGILTEGAQHILGWKSPHYLYHSNANPELKLLLRDIKFSDDISLRFSNPSWESYPLLCDTYMDWIADLPKEEQVVNIFMDLDALGIYQPLSSNILEFFKVMPECAKKREITFSTPSQIIAEKKSIASLEIPYAISWADEERDVSCWLGNVMQREAFSKLYSIGERVRLSNDKHIKQDWDYLQASNYFRFMTTKQNSVTTDRGIYESPYDAFTNYMNVLGDFFNRVLRTLPSDMDVEELNALQTTIQNQDKKIQSLERHISRLKATKTVSKPIATEKGKKGKKKK
ncbi:MAG TPA: glycoside hydrolase family 57 protein [Bacteroidaceae bacterium]|nr:glycoside hydrolase family 57 protein [Bacteroidaceae bacterium]